MQVPLINLILGKAGKALRCWTNASTFQFQRSIKLLRKSRKKPPSIEFILYKPSHGNSPSPLFTINVQDMVSLKSRGQRARISYSNSHHFPNYQQNYKVQSRITQYSRFLDLPAVTSKGSQYLSYHVHNSLSQGRLN
jgi:hypothetical protein